MVGQALGLGEERGLVPVIVGEGAVGLGAGLQGIGAAQIRQLLGKTSGTVRAHPAAGLPVRVLGADQINHRRGQGTGCGGFVQHIGVTRGCTEGTGAQEGLLGVGGG